MSYIGADKIKKMYLGGTEIAKAYLGSNLVYQNKYYDAEVEYLLGNGTQYIDTGVCVNLANDFEIGFTAEGTGRWGWVHQNVGNGTWITSRNQQNLTIWYHGFNEKITPSTSYYNGEYTIQITNSEIVFNNNHYTVNVREGSDSITNISLKFFLWYDFESQGIQTPEGIDEKFKNFYVKINNSLVRDYIPVRVGTTGYMYDKVSCQLFGNSGTGDFIVGPDKT